MNRVSVQKHVREGTDPYGKFTTDKMPFVPLRTSTFYTARGQHKPGSVVWLFMCPKLDRDGRCTIYSRRPKICRIYEPGCDRMCAHYTGKWKGSMRLYEEKKEK
jgi:Fe-S-cluster containining protein